MRDRLEQIERENKKAIESYEQDHAARRQELTRSFKEELAHLDDERAKILAKETEKLQKETDISIAKYFSKTTTELESKTGQYAQLIELDPANIIRSSFENYKKYESAKLSLKALHDHITAEGIEQTFKDFKAQIASTMNAKKCDEKTAIAQLPRLYQKEYQNAKEQMEQKEQLEKEIAQHETAQIHSHAVEQLELLQKNKLTILIPTIQEKERTRIILPTTHAEKTPQDRFLTELVKTIVLGSIVETTKSTQEIVYEKKTETLPYESFTAQIDQIQTLEDKIKNKMQTNKHCQKANITLETLMSITETTKNALTDNQEEPAAKITATNDENYYTEEQAAAYIFDLQEPSKEELDEAVNALRKKHKIISEAEFYTTATKGKVDIQNTAIGSPLYKKEDIHRYKKECMVPIHGEQKYRFFRDTVLEVDQENKAPAANLLMQLFQLSNSRAYELLKRANPLTIIGKKSTNPHYSIATLYTHTKHHGTA